MPEEYEVVWSLESVYDVTDISEYIELNFGKDRADEFNNEIDYEGKLLGKHYKMYSGTEIRYRQKVILKKVISPSIMFYFVDDELKTVFIIRVLRHERNWEEILKESISYTFDY